MIGSEDIVSAIAAWETIEWASPQPAGLSVFDWAPTESDVSGGLGIPFSIHWVELSRGDAVSVNQEPQTEDMQKHRIWVGILFAKSGDPLEAVSKRGAQWRDRYRAGMLMHLQHGIVASGGSGITATVMGQIEPLKLDLFNEFYEGIQVALDVTVRQLMSVGR